MANFWQDAVVFGAAAVAAAWLIRQRIRKRRSCADCALADAVARSRVPAAPGKTSGDLEQRAR
jgi:hypothetical protein